MRQARPGSGRALYPAVSGEARVASLAERYFRPKAFERDGTLYAWMGVVLFKRLLTRFVRVDPDRPVTNGYALGGRSLADVRAFERISRRSEIVHLLGLLLGLLFLGLTAVRGGLLFAGLLVFAANFPCFILQRYNRARACRVIERARRVRGERQVAGSE